MNHPLAHHFDQFLKGRRFLKNVTDATLVWYRVAFANYTSTISVAADGAGSMTTWVGKYDAKGASDAEAKKVIDGIYDSGLKALAGD